MSENTGTILRMLMLYLGIGIILVGIVDTIILWDIIEILPFYTYIIGGIILIIIALVIHMFSASEMAKWIDIAVPVIYLILIYPLLWFPIGLGVLSVIVEILSWIMDIAIVIVAVIAVISLIKAIMMVKE